jgi:hypothetical protein
MPRRGSTVGSSGSTFEQYSAQAAREAELATYYAHKARETAAQAEYHAHAGQYDGQVGILDRVKGFLRAEKPSNEPSMDAAVKKSAANPVEFLTRVLQGANLKGFLDVIDTVFTGSSGGDGGTPQDKATRLLLLSGAINSVAMNMLLKDEQPKAGNVVPWLIQGALSAAVAQGLGVETIATLKDKLVSGLKFSDDEK